MRQVAQRLTETVFNFASCGAAFLLAMLSVSAAQELEIDTELPAIAEPASSPSPKSQRGRVRLIRLEFAGEWNPEFSETGCRNLLREYATRTRVRAAEKPES